MPAVNEEITKAPPRERTVIEGNIVEHPIWRVSNPQDRPKRLMVDKETGKVLVDPGTMKPREYVDPEDYTQVIDLGPDPADPRIDRWRSSLDPQGSATTPRATITIGGRVRSRTLPLGMVRSLIGHPTS